VWARRLKFLQQDWLYAYLLVVKVPQGTFPGDDWVWLSLPVEGRYFPSQGWLSTVSPLLTLLRLSLQYLVPYYGLFRIMVYCRLTSPPHKLLTYHNTVRGHGPFMHNYATDELTGRALAKFNQTVTRWLTRAAHGLWELEHAAECGACTRG